MSRRRIYAASEMSALVVKIRTVLAAQAGNDLLRMTASCLKRQARIGGEKAAIRLALPMGMMLIVVLVIIMVPALLSF